MTPPLTSRPDRPLEPTVAAETTSTQLFGVLYINLTGLVDSVVPNSGPWSLLGQSALPAGLAVPHPEPLNASTYDWLPHAHLQKVVEIEKNIREIVTGNLGNKGQPLIQSKEDALDKLGNIIDEKNKEALLNLQEFFYQV
ncbi:hypothetical protein DSO57_1009114 [Entomophthora muscae]|uniref:Uncharacterized protein n=1 Tax=Entomophthora muscae TaxID=34485 RepID=A0ACC2RY26_9FUNG|nr:hypothetical protein DSO57_1009114 [Entomophthora muscae]